MLPERLKVLRKKKCTTQKEIAEYLDIVPSNYAQYESGARTPPSDKLQKLADYFNVSTDYLLGRTDNPTPPDTDEVFALSADKEYKDLPPEALQEIENFKQYVLNKYKK